MSITDELSGYINEQQWCAKGMLTAIADRIDAEHEEAIKSVMNDALYHANDKDMADLGWVRLPEDADGEYIHVGDVMEWPNGKTFDVVGIGDGVLFYIENADGPADWTGASTKRHHKPTVEDVLREFGKAWVEWEDGSPCDPIAQYAPKLRLVGGDAE